jgi:hypothetical protein
MPRRARRTVRPGSALILVLVLTVAIGALAASAILLAGNTKLVSKYYDRERDFRYASEAALQMAKSELNNKAYTLPDTGYRQISSNATILDADQQPIPGVQVNLWVAPTGSTSGQFGHFASLVSEAHDATGARYVRRLELAQESFARYAYWSDKETNTSGTTIYFNNGDNLFGPVWSNDVIHIGSGGAHFYADVGTAQTVSGATYGQFDKGYQQNQKPVPMPKDADLAKLSGYANSGNFSFAPPSNGGASSVLARLEFYSTDLDADGDSTGTGEGFFRVYYAKAGKTQWLRGDYNPSNCGDWHSVTPGGPLKFFPAAVHSTSASYAWVGTLLKAGGMTATQANAERAKSLDQVMQQNGARCYLGGDPHLAAIERLGNAAYALAQQQIGGEDTTFTPAGNNGSWQKWPGTVPAALAAKFPGSTIPTYLFPIYRGQNPGTQGVIYFNGTVGISGVLRGSLTLYAKGDVVILDDQRYANDPSLNRCRDILGIIASNNVDVADNALNDPPQIGGVYKVVSATPDLFLHAVIMAINTSFQVENYSGGPNNALNCGGQVDGRGCLYLTGGLIQEARGPVGLSDGHGYVKRYSYDRCVLVDPPPYFPTTGRYVDNRYYELDPVGFNVGQLFSRLAVHP